MAMAEQSAKLSIQIERNFLQCLGTGQQGKIDFGDVGAVCVGRVGDEQILEQTQLFGQNVNFLDEFFVFRLQQFDSFQRLQRLQFAFRTRSGD